MKLTWLSQQGVGPIGGGAWRSWLVSDQLVHASLLPPHCQTSKQLTETLPMWTLSGIHLPQCSWNSSSGLLISGCFLSWCSSTGMSEGHQRSFIRRKRLNLENAGVFILYSGMKMVVFWWEVWQLSVWMSAFKQANCSRFQHAVTTTVVWVTRVLSLQISVVGATFKII